MLPSVLNQKYAFVIKKFECKRYSSTDLFLASSVASCAETKAIKVARKMHELLLSCVD